MKIPRLVKDPQKGDWEFNPNEHLDVKSFSSTINKTVSGCFKNKAVISVKVIFLCQQVLMKLFYVTNLVLVFVNKNGFKYIKYLIWRPNRDRMK